MQSVGQSGGGGGVGPGAGAIDGFTDQLGAAVINDHCASSFSGAAEDRGGVIGGTAVDDRAGNRGGVVAQGADGSVW